MQTTLNANAFNSTGLQYVAAYYQENQENQEKVHEVGATHTYVLKEI